MSMVSLPESPETDTLDVQRVKQFSILLLIQSGFKPVPAATVYGQANLGRMSGKTAKGLIRHSPNCRIVSVIDSAKSGFDADYILDGECNGTPVCASLKDAINNAGSELDGLIFGLVPSSGLYSESEKSLVLEAEGLFLGGA